MKISVIIPLYNKASYIEKALQSVVSQTFTDWELIVVDDGSIDGSLDIAKHFLETATSHLSPFTFHLLTQSNSGVGAARNRGVVASHGDFVCFLDADDWWEPTFLAEMVDFTSQYPDAGLWACNYIYYKPGKTRVGVKHPTGYMNYPKCYYENVGMPIITGSFMLRRIVFDEVGGYLTDIKLGEDFLLWSKIAHLYKIAFLDKPLAYYNNDVPVTLRATRNLHVPSNHMLWYVDDLVTDEEWKRLIDQLRVSGLMEYWLSKVYNEVAKAELNKVDWSKIPPSYYRKYYKTPIYVMKMKNKFMKVGSKVKQTILKLL